MTKKPPILSQSVKDLLSSLSRARARISIQYVHKLMFSCGFACTDIPQGTFPSFIVVIGKGNSFFVSMEITKGYRLNLKSDGSCGKVRRGQGYGQQWLLRNDAVSLLLTLKPTDHC